MGTDENSSYSRKRSLVLAVVLVAVAAMVYLYMMDSRAPAPPTANIDLPLQTAPSPTITNNPDSVVEEDASQAETQLLDSDNCLTIEQLESHPLLVDDSYRFDSVGTSGPTIGAYRGLSASELRGLATQGDSAAMAVLGAMAVMRSRDQPEDKAVAYLMHEDSGLQAFSFKRPLEESAIAHLEEASEWFYKAALNGRIMALYHVGDLLWLQEGGPVELGWIDKEEYDALSSYQRTALLPANIYNVLAFEIAPELRSGPYGNVISEIMPQTERQQQILNELRDQFERDLKSAELPPISVAASDVPPFEELKKMLCQSALDQLEDAASN